jgi:hypothetical protein
MDTHEPEPAGPAGLQNASGPEPAGPAGLQDTPGPEPAAPAGLQNTPGPEPAAPAGLQDTPEPEPAAPADLQNTPGPEPAGPAGLQDTPGPEPAGPAGLQNTPGPEPAAPAGLQGTHEPEPAGPAGLQDTQPDPTGPHLDLGLLRIGPRLFPLYRKVLALNVGLTLAVFVVYALGTGQPVGARWSLFDVLLQAAIITGIFALADAVTRTELAPGNLAGRYLRAVARRLPREQRADIVRELAENLREEMEERESELGRPLTTADEEALLKQHGHPLLVAGRYRADQRTVAFGRQLIGPALFPFYARVLRLNLWITLAAGLASLAILELASTPSLLPVVPALLLPLLVQFAVVTAIFAGVEIYLRRFPDRWSPRDLPDRPASMPASPDRPGMSPAALSRRASERVSPDLLAEEMQPVSRLDSFARLLIGSGGPRVPRLESLTLIVFTVPFLLWWLAVPRFLPLLFPPGRSFLQPGPGWRAFYQPALWVGALGLVQPLVNLLFPRWTRFRAAARTATTALFLLVVAYSLSAGPWLLSAPAAGDPAAHQRVAATIDLWCRVSLLTALAITALLLGLELRRLLRHPPGTSAGTPRSG